MARVRPFRAWRYARTQTDITPLIAPPYDVISPEQREMLLGRDVHNVVALELAEGPLDPNAAGNRYENAERRWNDWRASGVLAEDAIPAFYLLEQRFEQGGRTHTRRSLFAAVGIEPFEAGIVLPHERTLPKALGDRFALIERTGANFSAVLSLYDDPELRVDRLLGATLATEPLETATGDDGVDNFVWAVTDPELVEAISAEFDGKRLFIADGHHRYTTALAYRDQRRARAMAAGDQPADPGYDYVLMALVNMDDPDLQVLPTHRVADAPGDFDAADFLTRLGERFDITDLPPGHPGDAFSQAPRPAFLVLTRGETRPKLAVLREDVDLEEAIRLPRTTAWKQLDVAVLQELVLEPLLGIHPDRPETLDRLTFVKDAHGAMKQVSEGQHDVAFVLRPTGVDELREVALSGETMPQKSTYFHPKLPSGLLFRDLG